VANPDDGGVVVHQDGGRVRVEEMQEDMDMKEIPPLYESILREDRTKSGSGRGEGTSAVN